MRTQAIAALREFRAKYRRALARWVAGGRDVLFPAGTWKMKELYGAQAEAFG